MIVFRHPHPDRIPTAFTLVEMVVVVALVALLAAISIGVGASMVDSGRQRATEGVLEVLDKALDDYVQATGSNPPALVKIELDENLDSYNAGDTVYYPAVDGRFDLVVPGTDPERHYEINSVGLFAHSIKAVVDIEGVLSQVDNRFVKNIDIPGDLQPRMLTVFDAWGNPIRYVHPKFDGILEDTRRVLGDSGDFLAVFDTDPNTGTGFFTEQFLPVNLNEIPFIGAETDPVVRRNKILQVDQEEARSNPGLDYPVETDSDGGSCPSQRPYFYSSGPDGDPATIEDNVYTTVPTFIDPL